MGAEGGEDEGVQVGGCGEGDVEAGVGEGVGEGGGRRLGTGRGELERGAWFCGQ